MPELRRENQRAVPLNRALAPRIVDLVAAVPAETREPITETCADCQWPDTCLRDETCWEAVRGEREEARQERVRAARAPREREETEMEGLSELEAMDHGERVNGSEPVATECKIPGCDEPWLSDRGRFAKLCETHKAEALARAKAEGSLGSKKKREPKPRRDPAPTSDSWDDLRALVAGLFAHTFTLVRCEDGTELTALQDRLVTYLEAQGLADRRNA